VPGTAYADIWQGEFIPHIGYDLRVISGIIKKRYSEEN
jgi:hypothetical protein